MELAAAASATPFALWLNSFFSGYDYSILDFMNTLAVNAGGILTPIMKAITFIGEKGIIFFLLAFILVLSPKTRKLGVCVFGAVSCGYLVNNIILKEAVARVRPFLDTANEHFRDYKSFWDAVGSPAEDGFSFTSGHVTAAAAGMFALLFSKGKKMIVPSIAWIGLTMVSRNYLVAHYPSDCLFGLIIGIASALIAWGISNFIFNWLDDNGDYAFCNWILTAKLPFSADEVREKASGSLESIKGKASESFDSIKGKASDSFDSIKGKASNLSMPDIDIKGAGKKLLGDKPPKREAAAPKASKKESSDWNSRWAEYKKSKYPQGEESAKAAEDAENAAEEDVKVFTGTKKAAPVMETKDKKIENVPAAEQTPTEEEILKAPTKNAKKGAMELDLDNWDDLSDFINADIEPEIYKETAPEKSTKSSGGAYRGRHVK